MHRDAHVQVKRRESSQREKESVKCHLSHMNFFYPEKLVPAEEKRATSNFFAFLTALVLFAHIELCVLSALSVSNVTQTTQGQLGKKVG